MENVKFNFYEDFRCSRYTHLDEIVNDIKTGTYHRTIIPYIKLFDKEGKTEETKNLKNKIPTFIISGMFSKLGRKIENLRIYHGWMVLDIDGIKDEETYQIIFEKVKNILYTMVAFRSPSGGMKIIVQTNNKDVNKHSERYKKLVNYYEEKLDVEFDTSTCDVSRLCFYSYDEQIFYNKEAKVFNFEEINNVNTVVENADILALEMQEMIEFTEKRQKYKVGNRNNFIKLFSLNCSNHGIKESDTLEFCLSRFVEEDFDEYEITLTIKNSYEKNSDKFGDWKNRLNKVVKERLATQKKSGNKSDALKVLTKDISFEDDIFQQYYNELSKTFPTKYTDFVRSLKTEREKDILILGMMTVFNSIQMRD
ncbi:MAG: hypothetical protein JSS94_06825 [Bacteroidetes bacterium]|nr:hypothetical protein [Bacteroidota bacterium]